MNELIVATGPEIRNTLIAYHQKAILAYPPNTVTARNSDLKIYSEWCITEGHVGYPASGDQIAAYIIWLMEVKGAKEYTIRRRVSTITQYHKACKLPNPVHDGEAVTLAYRMVKLHTPRKQKQAKPLLYDDLDELLMKVERTEDINYLKRRNRVVFMLAYDTLMRRSELARLKLSHFHEINGNYCVEVPLSHGLKAGNSNYRNVTYKTWKTMQGMVSLYGIANSGEIFKSVKNDDKVTPTTIGRVFKKYGYTGHSGRVGGAIDQRAAGCSILEICQSGGWADSAMPLRYTEQIAAQESGSAKLARRREELMQA